MALTETVIANEALMRIGISRQITSVGAGTLVLSTDTTTEKSVCEFWFPRCRDRLLQEFPWTFARKYATLVLSDDGTDEVWIDEWENAYVYPTDCLRIRRFVTGASSGYYGTGWGFDSDTRLGLHEYAVRYVVRQHAGAKVIMTDVETTEAKLEYTAQVTDAGLLTEQFGSALAWLMATEIATPLSVNDEIRQAAMQGYLFEIGMAQANSANEEEPRDEPDGVFLRSRGGS